MRAIKVSPVTRVHNGAETGAGGMGGGQHFQKKGRKGEASIQAENKITTERSRDPGGGRHGFFTQL